MAYLCESCSNNNHGWCTVKKMNGLKKKNIQRCSDHNLIAEEDNGKKVYCIEYEVFNVPGRDKGFRESFMYETEKDDLDAVEDYALEYLNEYFYAGNFSILYIGVVK